MKTKGIIFTYDEIEELNENGYLTDYQLLDDNGGDPYGNCVIVLKDQFREGEIDELNLSDLVEEVYYTNGFSDEQSELNFSGKWYAKGCTGEAIFADYSDFTIFENGRKFIVLQKMYAEEEGYFIARRKDFEDINLCECYDRWGNKIGCYDAGCYSLNNSASDAKSDCTRALCEKYGIDPDDVEENLDDILNGECEQFSNVDQEELKSFVEDWEKKNEYHCEVQAWVYWDGSNYKTIVLSADNNEQCDVKEVDEEIRNSILVELPDNPYVEGATKSVETENYRFTFSRYADNPWYCEVIEK